MAKLGPSAMLGSTSVAAGTYGPMNLKIICASLLAGASLLAAPALAQTPASDVAIATPDRPLTAADLEGLRADLR